MSQLVVLVQNGFVLRLDLYCGSSVIFACSLFSFPSLFVGSNSSLNTSLPSPGAWPYSASDNSFTNVHSTSGMEAFEKGSLPSQCSSSSAFLSHFEYDF